MPYARRDIITWQPGMYYHIYNRGAHQLRIFRESTNYLFTMRKIKEHAKANQISMIAYSLIPTHYHFLIRQDGDKPAGILPQSVFNSYSKAYNKMYSHSGTLFAGRFRAKAIQADSHLLHLCHYIHGNPVKAELVADPADWPYSNYLEWIKACPSTLVDQEFIKEQFSSPAEYKKFLFQYLQTRDLPEDGQRHIWDIERG